MACVVIKCKKKNLKNIKDELCAKCGFCRRSRRVGRCALIFAHFGYTAIYVVGQRREDYVCCWCFKCKLS